MTRYRRRGRRGFRRDAGIGVKKAPPISAAIFVLLVAAALSI